MKIGEKIRFDYIGEAQEVTLERGIYKFECWGASGGNAYASSTSIHEIGGCGGYTSGEIKLTSEKKFFIYVGGKGESYYTSTTIGGGGYNGGGDVAGYADSTSIRYNSGGGGGATDIRLMEDNLYSRIIIAGGGGGNASGSGATQGRLAGHGGGENGTDADITYVYSSEYLLTKGGTQQDGGTGGYFGTVGKGEPYNKGGFGQGGSVTHSNTSSGGGGGGWYGGGQSNFGSGGGGSGYVLTIDSYEPEGYTPTNEYYMNNPILITGGNEMPSPNDGTFTGTANTDGTCIITRLEKLTPSPKTYTYNQIGSTEVTIPENININDSILFNITNKNTTTKYNGTMLTYTFPFNCKVRLNARGARGGKGNGCTDAQVGKGARASGDFEFKQGDTLLICVGQAGTDYVGSYSDGATGAGGGGTFVCLKNSELEPGDRYTGSGVGNDWSVKPLVIGAGGNGGRDVRYSGTGTIYYGLYTSSITSHINGSYAGGSYNAHNSDSTSGKSFLIGAQGATANYTRGSTSYAGFGCGGGNTDDGYGGGGGGYWNGSQYRSATSYVSPLAIEKDGEDGENYGEGSLIIEFLSISLLNGYCKVKNEYQKINSMSVKIDDEWREVTETYVKVDNEWQQSL